MDAIAVLKRDHEEVERLFPSIRETDGARAQVEAEDSS